MPKKDSITEKNFKDAIADAIGEIRQKRNLSSIECAQKLCTSRTTFFYWESGIYSPSFLSMFRAFMEGDIDLVGDIVYSLFMSSPKARSRFLKALSESKR